MQHAAQVRVMHRLRDGGDEFRRAPKPLRAPHSALRVQIREGAAFHQLHAEILLPFVLANFVDGNDVRMVEIRRGFRFGAETLHFRGGRQLAGADHFQRDRAIETDLPRIINDAHPALRNLAQEFVIAKVADDLVGDFGFRNLVGRFPERLAQETLRTEPARGVAGQARAADGAGARGVHVMLESDGRLATSNTQANAGKSYIVMLRGS